MSTLLRQGVVMRVPVVADARMALIRVTGQTQNYDCSLLMHRIERPKWIVSDPDGLLTVDGLSREEVIPLVGGAEFPRAGRPFLIRADVSDAWMSAVRAVARAFAELQGATLTPVLPSTGSVQWVYVDPLHSLFGMPVDDGAMSIPGGHHL